jgi:alkanesulfonate monooxygenase SsuD/methylene tetrahydromethanopterin reductase-like flavin-dependent oxidoreductase (luciferase family)
VIEKGYFHMGAISSKGITFGIMLGPFPPWEKIVGWAKLVESLGFDKLWLPDHFVNPDDKDMDWFDCWCTLAALATQTEKITIGSLVSSMTLRNPAVLAHMALALDHISGGRFELGVGAAGSRKCHEMTGVPRWEPKERSACYKEFIEILFHMINNEVTTYKGNYYNIHEAIMHPQFIAKPHPVFNIAAHGPKALRLAGQYGDAWNTLGPMAEMTPKQSSDEIHRCYEFLRECANDAGRDPDRFGRTMLFGWTCEHPFASLEAFYDVIGRYSEAGINDFSFIYAPWVDLWKDQAIQSESMLRKIAEQAIPTLRSNN